MDKMTYVKALSFVMDNCAVPEDVSERLAALKASIEKKNSAPRKPTADQLANQAYKDAILAFLTDAEKPMTVAEITAGVPELAGSKPQKVSGLMRSLEQNGFVTVTKVKRLSAYSIAGDEESPAEGEEE